jgi:elongation factor P
LPATGRRPPESGCRHDVRFEEADPVISTNQFRTGMTIRYEGDTYRIVDFQHVKPGKGGAFVRTKLKNVTTGRVVERTFRPEQKFDQVRTESRGMTYLYEDPDQVVFMDAQSYEQLALPKSVLEDKLDLMTVNMEVELLFMDEQAFDVELPVFVDLEVTETAPGVRGDTVSGGSKSATLETGASVQVPLFIETGDVIRIDTRTREYNTRI